MFFIAISAHNSAQNLSSLILTAQRSSLLEGLGILRIYTVQNPSEIVFKLAPPGVYNECAVLAEGTSTDIVFPPYQRLALGWWPL